MSLNSKILNSVWNESKNALNTTEIENNYDSRYSVSGSYVYIGYAVIGTAEATASWQIQRYDISDTSNIKKAWASKNINFDKKWTDKSTYF